MKFPVTIVIDDGYAKTYAYRQKIGQMGFLFDSEYKNWIKEVSSESELNEIEEFCGSKGLSFISPFTKRSNGYRDDFFNANAPIDKRGKYRCVYCGRKQSKERITIDHLISVRRAQKSQKSRDKLRAMECDSVNDIKNLVPACKHCNSSKGHMLYPWLWIANIGKRENFWKTKNALIVCLFAYLIIGTLFDIFTNI